VTATKLGHPMRLAYTSDAMSASVDPLARGGRIHARAWPIGGWKNGSNCGVAYAVQTAGTVDQSC
jgi:hypothetical protein